MLQFVEMLLCFMLLNACAEYYPHSASGVMHTACVKCGEER